MREHGSTPMLQRLFADNYRCFVNFEFRPHSVNLLLGDNGSGKSSLFDVLAALQDLLLGNEPVQKLFPSYTLTAWDRRSVQRFELEVQGSQGLYAYTLEVEHEVERGAVSLRKERLELEGRPLYRFEAGKVQLYREDHSEGASFAADARRSFLAALEGEGGGQKLAGFKQCLQRLWLLSPAPRSMEAISRAEAPWLERDGSNFASWYRRIPLEAPEVVQALHAEIAEILEGFQSLRLAGAGGEARELQAKFASGSNGSASPYDIAFNRLSDGQRALIFLYTVLLAAQPGAILCFDEPDNYVALREIQPWLTRLSDVIDERGGQVLIISHHPEVIDYLAADHAFKFERPNGGPARVQPFGVDRSTGLRASELVAQGAI